MEQLFAPWRIEWVEREPDDAIDGCPFCVLPTRTDARDARIVAESDHTYVLLNNFPYNPGHVMVIPHEHTGEYTALSPTVVADHARVTQHTIQAFHTGFEPDGVNTGLNLGDAAGGSIDDHLHTHVVPRWHGDTNFMPVTADTKVIVQAVDETYDQLHDAFTDQPDTSITDSGAVYLSV